MSRHCPIFDLRRPLPNRDAVNNALRGGRPRLARASHEARSPKMSYQLLLEDSSSLHKKAAIDCLVGHPHSQIIRECAPQANRDLPGRPILLQLARHPLAQTRLSRQPTQLRSACPSPSLRIRRRGAIALTPTIAVDFAADGRRATSQLTSNSANRHLRRNTTRDFLPLRNLQRPCRSPSRRRRIPACLADDPQYRRRSPIQAASNINQRQSALPPIPQRGSFSRRKPPSLPHH